MDSAFRILIVDDNAVVRRSLEALLKEESMLCEAAPDVREALKSAATATPDVVLLDVNLEGVSGPDAARLIRQKLPETAIIMMSAADAGPLSSACAESEANAWIDKARIATDLVPIIKRCCTKPRPHQAG